VRESILHRITLSQPLALSQFRTFLKKKRPLLWKLLIGLKAKNLKPMASSPALHHKNKQQSREMEKKI
jgi:hypothetical protein